MKRACKRFLSLLLAFVMLFGLFGMAQTVYAMGSLQNVKISSSGILTWDPFPGAKVYVFSCNGAGSTIAASPFDVNDYLAKDGKESGKYTIALYAVDNHIYAGGKPISEIWATTYNYNPSYSYKLGDVDKNGAVNTADALMALKMAVGIIKPTNEQKNITDVDKDGKITTADALKILKYAVGIIKGF
ncbi:MAG: dockerin type I repeat-containing protein [Clostridia bacterium]|nr:dockerin type I repeat-containing protein [Clostridia bacterium]